MNIFTNSITSAVYTVLTSWQNLIDSGTNFHHLPALNTDMDQCPWIGVMRPTWGFDPFRSNIISPYNCEISIPIICQFAGFDFDDVETRMKGVNDLSDQVFSAVSCYRSFLNSVVNIWKGGLIEPYNDDLVEPDNIVMNRIILIAEVFG